MTETFLRWDPVDFLKSEEDMAAYLNACMAEDPGDGRLIRAALGDIARAFGMNRLEQVTGIPREGLIRAFSADGNPEFTTIMKVVRALGLQWHAAPVHEWAV